MGELRKPFQGVGNIIRFNWQFYVWSLLAIVLIILLRNIPIDWLHITADVLLFLIVGSIIISLSVSWYIYDLSGLYRLSWLDKLLTPVDHKIININAGFDETSSLINHKFPQSELSVFDFYDPVKHTAVSIKRARKAYPAFPNTIHINTNHLPLVDNSTDKIFLILAAHEIRDDKERICFFKELRRTLTQDGQIIVTEHLRDKANFLAYNIGFFHFHAKRTWLKTFQGADLHIKHIIKINPFITTFILDKNATTP